MNSLVSLINRVREGDADAYGSIVRRFQDMAVGYAYALLRDFQLAEDAAQEAFFEAYRDLPKLREAAAFPGWFRCIVFKQCDRIKRRNALSTVALQLVEEQISRALNPAEVAIQNQMKDKLWQAIESLPERERATLTLYYISGYSQNEVGAFLDVPVTTVKKRLFSARNRLREMLMATVENHLRQQRPSRDEGFANRLMEILQAARSGDAERVKGLLEQDPRLRNAKDPLGNTALILAVNSGHHEIAELLLLSGLQPDIYEAAAIGKTERVAELIKQDRTLLDSFSPEGFTPFALASHFGHLATVEFLFASGANINAVSKNELQVTPLHAALFEGKIEIAKWLIENGAAVNRKRGGNGWSRAGWTALHYAARYGFSEIAILLIEHGADLNAKDAEDKTPLDVALQENQNAVAEILVSSQ
ncbi:MAG: sigma-70 family RNA polymerase sigma factor [Acidobacteria bacterium]|nr:sigma-70 family RNA polymerase sigma factor [Acidobacteriota bacterium]